MNKSIKTVYANIYSKPTFSSELVNQSLYLNSVGILELYKNWCLVDLYDGYKGWAHSFYLMDVIDINHDCHIIKSKFSNNQFTLLSFGTSLPIIDTVDGNIKSLNPTASNDWYPIDNILFNSKRDEIVYYLKQLLGIPYLWGGRSSYGIDCSGLVQLVFHVAGISFPRDTSEQLRNDRLIETSINKASPGDIVFFSENDNVNHVGVYIGNDELIHSSGSVKVESFNYQKCNFSEKLKNMFYKVYSIDKLISN